MCCRCGLCVAGYALKPEGCTKCDGSQMSAKTIIINIIVFVLLIACIGCCAVSILGKAFFGCEDEEEEASPPSAAAAAGGKAIEAAPNSPIARLFLRAHSYGILET
jgi:hypothetical protein